MSEALKSCPFCGGTDAETEVDKLQGTKWGRVVCRSCGACGEEVRTGYDQSPDAPWRAEAIAAWNRRSAADDETIRLQDEYIAKLANGPAADEIERLRRLNRELTETHNKMVVWDARQADEIERLRRSPPSPWRDMESAPKDGTTIELCAVMPVHSVQRDGDSMWRPETPQTQWRLTGWRLPEPAAEGVASVPASEASHKPLPSPPSEGELAQPSPPRRCP